MGCWSRVLLFQTASWQTHSVFRLSRFILILGGATGSCNTNCSSHLFQRKPLYNWNYPRWPLCRVYIDANVAPPHSLEIRDEMHAVISEEHRFYSRWHFQFTAKCSRPKQVVTKIFNFVIVTHILEFDSYAICTAVPQILPFLFTATCVSDIIIGFKHDSPPFLIALSCFITAPTGLSQSSSRPPSHFSVKSCTVFVCSEKYRKRCQPRCMLYQSWLS